MEDFSLAKRIVIKIGSSLLVENGVLKVDWLQNLVQDILWLRKQNVEVVIVSSGAVALGRLALQSLEEKILGKEKSQKLISGKLSLSQKQAAAAIGQIKLMENYSKFFAKEKISVAQILLTKGDCDVRERYLNIQNTFAELLAKNIMPIINENDTVSVDEIKIGDNDRLAARVAQIISADLLILFSDIDGLYDKNPRVFKDAEFINEVKKINKKIEEMAGGSGSVIGTGGMITKIIAAKMATGVGSNTIITNGLPQGSLKKLWLKKQKYTIFRSDAKSIKSRKKWLSGFLNCKGEVVINNLAKKVLLEKKSSLLPVGIIKIFGDFDRGDLVAIKDEDGNHIGSGSANYKASQLSDILGKHSAEIKEIFSKEFKTEFIHIDNLILI